MIQVSDIRLSVEADEEGLRRKLSKLLKRPVSELGEVHIVRQSVDARKKDQIQLVYTVQLDLAEESAILRRQLRQVPAILLRNRRNHRRFLAQNRQRMIRTAVADENQLNVPKRLRAQGSNAVRQKRLRAVNRDND